MSRTLASAVLIDGMVFLDFLAEDELIFGRAILVGVNSATFAKVTS